MSSSDPSLEGLNTIPTSIMWIGAGITLLTTIISSLGLSIQQRSYRRPFAKVNYNNIFSVLFEKYMWTIGFCVYIVGSLSGSICSIGALPVTLLAPIGSFSLITNAVFAKLLLDDVWTAWSMLATLVILVGAFFIGFFGIIPETFKTVEELVELFARKEFIIYFTIQEILIILILTWNTFNEFKLKKFNTTKQTEHLPFPKFSKAKNDTIVGLIYGTMSIILSTQGVLFCKSGIQLIGLSIGGNNQFNKPFTWVIVIMLISVTLIQLFYFNMGIKYCDLVVLMPANYCVYTCFCLLNGLVYFNQWNMLTWWKLLLVALGSVILSVGVLLLSLRPKAKDQLTSKDSNGNPDQSQLLLSQNNLPIENLYSSNSEINDHYDHLIENSGAGEGDDYYGDMLDDLTLRLIEIHSTNNEGDGYEAQWNQISSTLNQEGTAFDNESNSSGNSMDIL